MKPFRSSLNEVFPAWEAVLEVYLSGIPSDPAAFHQHHKVFKEQESQLLAAFGWTVEELKSVLASGEYKRHNDT